NYNSCFGTGKAPAVGCPAKDKYKKVHTKYISRGFVLTNEDQNVGISTIDEKLESMCPHYHAMNDLMHNLTMKQHHPILSLLEMKLEAVTWKATMIIEAEENLADENNK
ncbi:hypothetical protein VP01_11703g1, partial [Puccinia sorghi]